MLRWPRTLLPVLAAGLFATAALVVTSFASALHAADWPQTGRTPQHTNFTPDSPGPPYKAIWRADFSPESIYSAQPVVADGRVFVTTLNGNLYALDAATGKRLWHFKAGEVVWGSAACGTREHGGAGLVFVASWDGFVYALDAETGQLKWKHDTGEPISGSPCLAEGTVFIGTRKGNMVALGADGAPKWKRPLSWQVFNTAAWDDGKVFVMTQDVVVHCLDARTGNPVWQSEQLWGWMPREFYPVVHKGNVLISITPSEWRHSHGFGPYEWSGRKLDRYSKLVDEKKKGLRAARVSLLRDGRIPPELEAAQKRLIQFYEKQPWYQSFYVLDEKTGKQRYHAVHLYESAGLQNLIAPPAVCADGRLVVNIMFGGARAALFDVEANRWTDYLFELWGTNNDEWGGAAVGGSRVFSKNMHRNQVVDIATRKVAALGGGSPRTVRVSVLPEEPSACWPGPRLGSGHWGLAGTSPPVIAGDWVLWMVHDPRYLTAYRGRSEK